MSPNVTALVLVWMLLPWAQTVTAAACVGGTATALLAAETAALSGEAVAAAAMLRSRTAIDPTCGELAVAADAWDGWLAALAAGAHGGTDAALSGVREALERLGPAGAGVSQSAYVTAVLRAAAGGAQQERDEMEVWLEHARDLAARLELVEEPARWPLPIDLVEGELWSSVDDHERAETSYTRALAGRDSALAWRGLARARARRDNQAGACTAYQRALALASPVFSTGLLATEARAYLRACAR